MSEPTPNGTTDLLDTESQAQPAYTIDDEEDPTPRGSDPTGEGERDPSLISRLSSGAAGTDEGSVGGEGKPSRQKEAALAEKTSKIMSDYQAYLNEIDSEFPGSTSDVGAEEAERNIENVRSAHRYHDHPAETFPPPIEGEYGEKNLLYRGWSHGSSDRGLHIDRGAGDFESQLPQTSGRATRLGSSRRVKRGIAMIVAVSLLTIISVSISKKKRASSLPDWEAQLAAEEEQQPPPPPPEASPGYNDGQITETQSHQYSTAAERYQPTFYDRSTGWTGQTYVEALAFCQDSNEFKADRTRVCPYTAICPGGMGSKPFEGHKNENGQEDIMTYGGSWIPVIDGPNEWVSVGSDNSCVLYSTLHNAAPEWGETGEGNEVNTRHLVCCNAEEVEKYEVEEMKSEEEEKAVAIAMSADAGDSQESGMNGVAMAENVGMQYSQEMEDEISKVQQDGDLPKGEEEALPYVIAAEKFKPTYFERKSGWEGNTYREAVEFCENKGNNLHVCPFQAICPEGIGEHPIRTFDTDSMMWVPVSDEANSWVSITRTQPCLPFKDQANWGPDTATSNAMTEYLVCCTITTDTKNLILGIEDLNKSEGAPMSDAEALVADVIANSPQEEAAKAAEAAAMKQEEEEMAMKYKYDADMAYQALAQVFEPVVHDRSAGWTGQTYLEALDFCAKSATNGNDRTICPLAAICPLGKGNNPSTGTKEDGPDGGFSWVPISDDANAWVQVSSRDTCLPYDYIHKDETPQWGLSGEGNEEITRYIFCCLANPGGDGPALASASVSAPATAEAVSAVTSSPTEEPTPNSPAPITESPTPGPTPRPTPEQTPVPTAEPTKPPTPEPTPAPTSEPTPAPTNEPTTSEGITSAEEAELYAAAAELYEPLIFSSTSSPAWTGQAYLEALQFCASYESRVPCPYTALCPAGPGKLPSGGVRSGFAPIMNHPNAWVSIGPEDTCKSWSDLNGSPPDWGLTGEGDPKLTDTILCCVDQEDNKSEATSEAENAAQEGIQLTETEQVVSDEYKPEWFGRGAGYQGSAYLDAIDFCANVAGKTLCPAMAYCPNGPQPTAPLFLQLDAFEGEQWAPVQTDGKDVDYIMIGTYNGDSSTTCGSYEELTGEAVPSWGLDGSSTELKTQVLCCHDPSYSTQGVINPAESTDLEAPVTQTEDSPTLDDGSFDLEGAVNVDLDPVWLDEEDGWDGGSHDDAEAFCNSLVGKSLCPYAAYCPHGPGQPVIGGHDVDFKTEGVQWAPIFGANNHWVLLSQKGGNSLTTCMSHTDLEGSEPDWGMSNARPWLKKHVMCCNLKNGF